MAYEEKSTALVIPLVYASVHLSMQILHTNFVQVVEFKGISYVDSNQG